jgi:hypothetical protein
MSRQRTENLKPAIDRLLKLGKERHITTREELIKLIPNVAKYVNNAKNTGSSDGLFTKEKACLLAAFKDVDSYAYKRIYDSKYLMLNGEGIIFRLAQSFPNHRTTAYSALTSFCITLAAQPLLGLTKEILSWLVN